MRAWSFAVQPSGVALRAGASVAPDVPGEGFWAGNVDEPGRGNRVPSTTAHAASGTAADAPAMRNSRRLMGARARPLLWRSRQHSISAPARSHRRTIRAGTSCGSGARDGQGQRR